MKSNQQGKFVMYTHIPNSKQNLQLKANKQNMKACFNQFYAKLCQVMSDLVHSLENFEYNVANVVVAAVMDVPDDHITFLIIFAVCLVSLSFYLTQIERLKSHEWPQKQTKAI
uniref:Uncharacterized protein n=1 Tax=Glossina brevipalpis TaxID=37001 RepID=A0A1A9W019_9MUSC